MDKQQKKSSAGRAATGLRSITQRHVVIAMWSLTALGVFVAVLLFTLAKFEVFGPMPSFEELENPKTNLATQLYSADGEVLGTYFIENRTHLSYDELFPENDSLVLNVNGHALPPIVAALVATEDIRFFDHSGIDFKATARAGFKTILMRQKEQGGGSTITQQLAKNLYKTRNSGRLPSGKLSTLTAKAQEYVIATQLEHNYTKPEIVAMYLNTVEFSNSNFGIKSAANNFFGCEPSELKIEQAALIAGQVKAPGTYAPMRAGEPNEKARQRRNLVLSRLADAGAISRAVCDSLSALPVDLTRYRTAAESHNVGTATYFREMVRQTMTAREPERRNYLNDWDYNEAVKEYNDNPLYGWCHKNRKANGEEYDIYRDGLKIYTTIDSKMQRYAEQAVAKQMIEVQKKMDAQIRATKSIFVGKTKEQADRMILSAMRQSDRWRNMAREGIDEKEILAAFSQPRSMKIFTFRGVRDTIITPRDSVVHHKAIQRAGFVAIDPHSGYVRAYVGGPDYKYFKYDAAKQGRRQVGSTAKPFIYTFAIDHLGLTPCTLVPNRPVSIETPSGVWSPKEAGKVEYVGSHPLYWGLARSRNNYSAWIMKQAKQPEAVAQFIHNMGIRGYIDPVPALCLGSYESNPFEMAGAYSTYANEGVRIDPIFVTRIEDNQGNVLATFTPKSHDAISKRVAYTMITMMQRVVTMGTAGRMRYVYGFSDVEMAAKTGTTNDNVDAWFMCVLPNLVMSTWVGGEENSIHLRSGGEGASMALPVAGEFLTRVFADGTLGVHRSDRFTPSDEVPDYDCPMDIADDGSDSTTTFDFEEEEFF